ncbi:MAG: hypothetical protein JRD05_00780 [Deltaproteobacteria bacterium]|nr:hypothetical protein [Deltaproteobacteria bacterium]
MKVIYPDRSITATADKENANYPAANVLDEHPKKLYKSTDNTAVLEVTTGAGSNGFAVFNTNAASVSAIVKKGEPTEWASGTEWVSGTEWRTAEDPSPATIYDLNPGSVGAMWGEYTQIDVPHIIELTFTAAAGTILECGVVVPGTVNTFDDPRYGVKEGLRDYSISKELNNGAFYYRKRDVVRIFNFDLIEDGDTDFYTFMHSIVQLVGPGPLAWRILHSGMTNWEWVVYARNDSMPAGDHGFSRDSSLISVSLVENI